MKKFLTKPVIIIASVVAVIAIAVLVLCLVKVKPVEKAVDGYTRAIVYSSDVQRIELEDGNNDDLKKDLDEAIDSTFYSVMQGILEGKASGKPAFKTELLDGANDETKVELAGNDIVGVTAGEGQYKVEFVYATAKVIEVEGEEVKFDRAIVLLGDSDNEIGEVEVVFYLDANVGNERPGDDADASENYKVTPVILRARTTKLYNAVKDIIASKA